MSRSHVVNWICDRCGNKAAVRAKTDTKLPDGWTKLQPPEGMELDLCGACAVIWDASFKAFFAEFSANAWMGYSPKVAGAIGLTNALALTPRAKNVLTLSAEEATRLNHHYIGTEHILLGLLREGEGIAAGVLESNGVGLDKMRGAIEFIVGKGSSAVTEDMVAEMDPETHPEPADD